jgi:hypothetical protein
MLFLLAPMILLFVFPVLAFISGAGYILLFGFPFMLGIYAVSYFLFVRLAIVR